MHLRRRHRLAAPALAVSLLSTTLPASAFAGPPQAPPTVLGLEGEAAAEQAAFDLTLALRAELDRRELGGGKDMSLLELKLTMGCEGNDAACLAEGGKTLEATELVYGSVTPAGDGFKVSLSKLDVAGANVTGSASASPGPDAFGSAEGIEGLAKDLIDQLYGAEKSAPVAAAPVTEGPPPEAQPTDEPAVEETRADTADGKYELGYQGKQTPTWKWVGLGVSGGLMVGALGGAIGTTLAIGPNGSLRTELDDAADDSLTDDSPTNDVDRNRVDDVCAFAREEINPDTEPGAVRNSSVTEVCNRADNYATGATVSWIATGVFAASTVAFTVLLFVHQKDRRAARLLNEHELRLGGAPLPGGGFAASGRIRF